MKTLFAALLAVALVSSACAWGRVDHPTGPADVVLRYSVSDAPLPAAGDPLTRRLALYGDGTLLLPDREAIGAFAWRELKLAPAGMQRLLAAAVEEAGLLDAPRYLADICGDCPTTVFELNLEGRTARVEAYGLGLGPSDERDATFERLESFAALLDDLDESFFAPEELILDRAYDPPGIELRSLTYLYSDVEAPVDWPEDLPELPAAGGTLALCGPQADRVEDLSGGLGYLNVTAGGDAISMLYRPLFPEEIGRACDEAEV